MRKAISYVLVLALVLLMAGLAQAATITVGPGAGYDFGTIQTGIDAANGGDTVLVAPGEYAITKPVSFRGKAVTVRSEAGRDETTIRMGTPADPDRASVVVFENNETAASILEGFTITGGTSSWVPSANAYAGGGIYFNASSGSLINCAVVKNRADNGGGGGVSAAYGASPILTNCILTGNSAAWGGGVLFYINSSMTMTDCIISGNSSLSLGGGVYGGSNSSITMTNCTIISNTVQDAGAGIAYSSSSATLTNCVIAQNAGGKWGGGLCSEYEGSSTTISNCTIWGNSAGEGGGMGCLNGASATVTNSVFWANTAHRGNEIFLEESPTRFSMTYSNVAGGQAGVCVQGASTLDWGPGNIDADPLFADPNNGDFHLKSEVGRWDPDSQTWVQDDATSPCIDAGDPDSDWRPEVWPHGMRANMGAYGGTLQASRSMSDAGNIADLNRDGIVDSADMCIIVDNWHTENVLCDIAPAPLGDGFVDVQDLIVLAEHLFEEVPPAEPVEVNEDDGGGQVELKLGQILVVTLESNPTTGYRWEQAENAESILKQIGEAEFMPSETGESPLVGAGGWEIFRFRASSAGQMTLQLVYRRPWEEGVEPLKTFSLQVVVP